MSTKPKELLFGPTLRGPIIARIAAGPGQFMGRTTLNSGSTTVTVSTALVNSDSVIRYGSEVSSVGAAAQSGGAVVVNSVVSGTSFAFARAQGVANPWNEVIMWEIVRTS